MNLRYENLKGRLHIRGVEKVVLDLGHGQLDHARITGLTGPDRHAQTLLLDIIAGLAAPSEGRLTYGARGTDGRWRYSPEVPHTRLLLVREKPAASGLLKLLSRRRRSHSELLVEALAKGPELLLIDEHAATLDAPLLRELDEQLSQAQRDTDLTVIIASGDSERLAHLCHTVLNFANGQLLSAQ
jgi:ABC-type sulfate/molybdate transport systems ATPase subunit